MTELLIKSFFNFILKSLILNSDYFAFTITIVAAFIGAIGSVLGGIIGGIVAYIIAKMQIDNERKLNFETENLIYKRHQQLLKNEIDTNQLFLNQITQNMDEEELVSIIKYSISNQLFLTLKTDLRINKFYELLLNYYRVFYRIQNDPVLLNKESNNDLLAEIKYLNKIQKQLKDY